MEFVLCENCEECFRCEESASRDGCELGVSNIINVDIGMKLKIYPPLLKDSLVPLIGIINEVNGNEIVVSVTDGYTYKYDVTDDIFKHCAERQEG